jgi:hypothetical protein
MPHDKDLVRLKFDLAYDNVQSIGHAQAKYVTALLTYIGVLFGLSLLGGGSLVPAIHLVGVDVPVEGVWAVTPIVTLVLTLAYIGTVTAMIPALSDLRQAEKELFGSQTYSMFAVDTTKNILDYLAILQLKPSGRTRNPSDDPGMKPWSLRLHHLILPALYIGSLVTSYSAIAHLAARCASHFTLAFTSACLAAQLAYTARPLYRYYRRLRDVDRKDDAYN